MSIDDLKLEWRKTENVWPDSGCKRLLVKPPKSSHSHLIPAWPVNCPSNDFRIQLFPSVYLEG